MRRGKRCALSTYIRGYRKRRIFTHPPCGLVKVTTFAMVTKPAKNTADSMGRPVRLKGNMDIELTGRCHGNWPRTSINIVPVFQADGRLLLPLVEINCKR